MANSLGDGAFYACSALFFTRIVGLSATRVGLALTLGWATGMLAGVPLGYLADRWGPRRTTVLLSVATAATLSTFLVVRSFPLFLLVVCVYACCQGGLASGRQALLAGLVEADQRTAVRAHLQSTLNGGLAIGAGLAKLTDREREVAIEVSRGRSNTEIAKRLYMSVALVLGRDDLERRWGTQRLFLISHFGPEYGSCWLTRFGRRERVL